MKSFHLYITFIFLFFLNKNYGQVEFGIDYNHEASKYIVSLKSNQTIASPMNMTGTAQITIRFESSDSFQVANIQSLVPNVFWNKTVRVNRPAEADDYDYITFGLSSLGSPMINYQKDVIVSLFTFENVGGACPSKVEIIDNTSDAFLYPNSEKLSIKNHISILGVGGNAYVGNYLKDANCIIDPIITSNSNQLEETYLDIFPNPAIDFLTVDYQVSVPMEYIKIYDVLGKVVLEQTVTDNQNQQRLDVSRLAKGSYFLRMENATQQSIAKPFIKIE